MQNRHPGPRVSPEWEEADGVFGAGPKVQGAQEGSLRAGGSPQAGWGLGGIPAEGGRLPARLAFPTACSSQPTTVRTLAEREFYELRGLTFLVGVELVLRAVLGLLNDQFPSLDIDFELQFLRDPQRFCLHLWEGGRGGKGKKRQWSSLLGAFSVPPMSASSM